MKRDKEDGRSAEPNSVGTAWKKGLEENAWLIRLGPAHLPGPQALPAWKVREASRGSVSSVTRPCDQTRGCSTEQHDRLQREQRQQRCPGMRGVGASPSSHRPAAPPSRLICVPDSSQECDSWILGLCGSAPIRTPGPVQEAISAC